MKLSRRREVRAIPRIGCSLLPLLLVLISFQGRAQGPYPPSLDSSFHQDRREALRDSMDGLSMAAFFSSPVRPRSKDIDHEYVPDKDLLYFSGLREKHSLLLVFSDTVEFDGYRTDELLFLPPQDPEDAQWHGARLGVEGAEDSLGIGKALPNTAFEDFELRAERFDHIHWKKDKEGVINDPSKKGDLASLLEAFQEKTDTAKERRGYEELHAWTQDMREVKEGPEVRALERAIEISSEAHKELMKAMKPGMWEYQAEALVEGIFRASACSGPGFPSIIGSGPNSCILHYSRNGDRIDSSDMVVIDIGGEYSGYSADITRTLPADGSFSEEQKAIYEIVLEAQKAGVRACRPGDRFWAPHVAAQKAIVEGLKELGIIQGRMGMRDYFMHGTSHYLGLDVHDIGTNGDLRPGNVLTVEPGIYIPEGSDCDPKWWNIGVRIEDDILITEDGHRNLSGSIPREPERVERMMKKTSSFPNFVAPNR